MGGFKQNTDWWRDARGPPVLLSNTPPGRLDSSRPLHVSGGLWRAVLPVIGEICSFGLQLQETLQLFTF